MINSPVHSRNMIFTCMQGAQYYTCLHSMQQTSVISIFISLIKAWLLWHQDNCAAWYQQHVHAYNLVLLWMYVM